MKTNWLFRNFAILSLLLFCALSVAAQNEPAKQSTLDEIVARPIPKRTVGLDPGKVKQWTLRDAILAALENNPDIELERANVRQAQYDVIAAQGAYDPLSTQGFQYTSTIQPNTRPFSGLEEGASSITSKNLNFNFGHGGLIYRTGGDYQVSFNNGRATSNSALFSTSYQPSLTFQITQPLWRNFKTDPNRNLIQINKKRLDLSDMVFRQQVIDIISRVQAAYWDLALAIRNEEVARASVTLAEKQLDNNKRQVEVGTLAPIEVVTAATQMESSRQRVFLVMNSVAQAENALKALTVNGPNDELWTSRIETVEKFDPQPMTIPVSDALKLAIDNRPELKQFVLQKDINSLNIDLFKNQAKPQINLNFNYTTFGVGGTPSSNNGFRTTTTTNCPKGGFPLEVNQGAVCADIFTPITADGKIINYRFNPNPTFSPITFTSTTTPNVADNFIGGYGAGLRNLFSNDFRQWSVGLNITLPWRSRTAKANLARAREEGKKLDLRTRSMMQFIEVEVRNAVQAVETAKMRIEATAAQKDYAARRLDGENKKFAAGMQATFFVLQAQIEFTQAELDAVSALADYNKAVANLQRILSTTLSSNSVEIRAEAPVTVK